jgi:hypothetical protein
MTSYSDYTVSLALVMSKAPSPSCTIETFLALVEQPYKSYTILHHFLFLIVIFSYLPDTTGDISTISMIVSW